MKITLIAGLLTLCVASASAQDSVHPQRVAATAAAPTPAGAATFRAQC
jgi:hypothetical protein